MDKTIKNNLVHARTVVYNTGYHIVWSTKYRREVLTGPMDGALKQIFLDIAEDKGFGIKEMGIMPDHVHVFASAHPKVPVGYIYKMLKGISARKLFVQFPEITKKLWNGKLWNPSTYVETIGHISEETVRKYINDQKKK